MTGDFKEKRDEFTRFCIENEISPVDSGQVIDLGAGNGIQTIALANLGFKVKAIDFNKQLLNELDAKTGSLPVEIIYDDIRQLNKYSQPKPELIICCGDTITHLDSVAEIKALLEDSFNALIPDGKIILTFRDYSNELEDTNRFIPVKSDPQKILTCFLEYFPDKVRVTDLLYEREDDKWIPKVSSYCKIRISRELIMDFLEGIGFEIILDKTVNRFITIIGQKKN